jgi:hypothetical protein
MKIHIFQSHYNVTGTDYKFRPNWFDYEKCFINLLNTIEGKDIDLHLIMDGNIEDNWVKKYKNKFIPHEIEGGNMEKAAMEMYRIAYSLLDKMGDKDLIYFLENDYLHVDGWDRHILDIYQCFEGLNYITLYDHYDKYFNPIYDDLVSKIFVGNTCHWRTTPSTCGSYIVPKHIFIEDYKDHTTIIGDHNKWLNLNETKERFILSPIPGLSTHCMEGLMSPTIDWKQINN